MSLAFALCFGAPVLSGEVFGALIVPHRTSELGRLGAIVLDIRHWATFQVQPEA